MEATLKPKRISERQEMPLVGVFGCLKLVIYGIASLWPSITLKLWTNESAEILKLDQ